MASWRMASWELTAVALAMFTAACSMSYQSTGTHRPFGETPSGEKVDLYTLSNGKGVEAEITNYGGIVVSLKVPDRNGKAADIVLGFDDFKGYLLPPPYFGAIIGRYANRIDHAQFTLDGVQYHLAKNNGDNSLHGGIRGFDKRVWTVKHSDPRRLELTYLSKDGEEGYPGNLNVTVNYAVTDENDLRINYSATTDKDTILNLTNHSYFNLAGEGQGDILGHLVMINADRFTPVDKGQIPTGELRSVEGTPFDFRDPHTIGERIDSDDEQLKIGGGYDHNFIVNHPGSGLRLAARITEPRSGRVLEISTSEPGIQFYTANSLDGSIRGKGGNVYGRRSAFCMETQHFPDSPNKPQFPSVILKPGDQFRSTTIYHFATDKQR